MRRPYLWATLALGAAILAAPPATSKEPAAIVRDFSVSDHTRGEWKVDDGTPTFPDTPTFPEIDRAHGQSLKIPVHFPTPAVARRGSNRAPRWLATFDRFAVNKPRGQAAKAVRFALYVPPERPPQTRVQAYLFLKNKDGLWFQGLARRRADGAPAVALESGWNELEVDLDENAGVLQPQGHATVWKTCYLPQMNSMGVVVTGDREWDGWVALDDVQVIMRGVEKDAAPLAFARLAAPGAVPVYGLWEASFDVNRQILNPYCTEEIDVTAEITPPGAQEPVIVPAFFAQDFRREKGSDRDGEEYRDRYVPQGEGRFLLRYTPRVAGEHRWRLVARYRSPYAVAAKTEECATPPATFAVAPAAPGAPAPRGFVRVSPKDPRCFEFENGEPFYIIGHNFHSPIDKRHVDSILNPYFPDLPAPKDRGLRCYEDAFPLMAANGINSFEVWMSSWWLGLEWTGFWKNYHGIGQYNQENAWKLDALLAAAAKHGLYAHLVIDNHGKASEFCDPEWDLSPYNADNAEDGGFCRRAQHLFTGDTGEMGKACYRDLYRYIAARWGWCTNIFGIETWSELDLIGRGGNFGRSEEMRAWLKEMMPWLRRWDQGKHPLTTHYCSDYRNIDREMAAQPCMDYVVGDAYHDPHQLLSQMLLDTHHSLEGFNKPFLITEFGGSPHATNLPSLVGDMYCGMWLSWMTAAAGTPYFWWYDFLRQENYYTAYGAFARYTAGEDRRRPAGGPQFTTEWQCAAQSAATDEFAKLIALEEADRAAHNEDLQKFQAEQTQRLLQFGQRAQALTKAITEAKARQAEQGKRHLQLLQQAKDLAKTAAEAKTRHDAIAQQVAAKTAEAEKTAANDDAKGNAEPEPQPQAAPETETAQAERKAEEATNKALDALRQELAAANARLEALAKERDAAMAAAQAAHDEESKLGDEVKELEKQLQDSRAAQRQYAEERNAERRRRNRTQSLVAAERLFRFYDPERHAEAQALAAKIIRLNAQVYGDGNVFYAFVYDRQQMQHLPLKLEERLLAEGLEFSIANVADGNFAAEFWDCCEGKVVGRADVAVQGGNLKVRLPPFRAFTALKLRRK